MEGDLLGLFFSIQTWTCCCHWVKHEAICLTGKSWTTCVMMQRVNDPKHSRKSTLREDGLSFFHVYLCVCVSGYHTQWDLFSRVGRQEEDEQSQSGDQDAWDEQIEAVVQGPSAHHHGECDVRVRLVATFVKTLAPSSWNLCKTRQQPAVRERQRKLKDLL